MTTNADRWKVARFNKSTAINAQAAKIEAHRDRYELVSKATGVPWDVIGVIHYREASGDFAGVLHDGEKIIGTGRKTVKVPKGRGPFSTWEEAAIDALTICPPYAAKNTDWSIGGTLDLLEKYNGLGYRNKGLPSPYLWAGTDQYVKGKYVADGKYDPNHVDTQLGCAAILLKLRDNAKPDLKPIIPPPPPNAPIPTHEAFPQPDVEPIDTPVPQPKSHKGLWLIGLIVVVVLVAAAIFTPIFKG